VNPKVRFAVAFIERNLDRDIYVEEVAQRVKLSPSRFCHLFKSETGVPFIQYLREARLEKACELLETTFNPSR
jgi:AraC family transcriptional regulator of arabinose operon